MKTPKSAGSARPGKVLMLASLLLSFALPANAVEQVPQESDRQAYHRVAQGVLACWELRGPLMPRFFDEEGRCFDQDGLHNEHTSVWNMRGQNPGLQTTIQHFQLIGSRTGSHMASFKGTAAFVDGSGLHCSFAMELVMTDEDASISLPEPIKCQ